jgi:hypothetical protein
MVSTWASKIDPIVLVSLGGAVKANQIWTLARFENVDGTKR